MSLITPTISRPTLPALLTLLSQELLPHDEALIIGDGPQPAAAWMPARDSRFRYYEHGPSADFGNSQRDFAISQARGHFLLFIDDDDSLVPGALARHVRPALARAPNDCHIFRMRGHPYHGSLTLGDLGGSMLICPNIPEKLGRWRLGPLSSTQPSAKTATFERDLYNYIRDYIFIRTTLLLHNNPPIVHNAEWYIADVGSLEACNAAPVFA